MNLTHQFRQLTHSDQQPHYSRHSAVSQFAAVHADILEYTTILMQDQSSEELYRAIKHF